MQEGSYNQLSCSELRCSLLLVLWEFWSAVVNFGVVWNRGLEPFRREGLRLGRDYFLPCFPKLMEWNTYRSSTCAVQRCLWGALIPFGCQHFSELCQAQAQLHILPLPTPSLFLQFCLPACQGKPELWMKIEHMTILCSCCDNLVWLLICLTKVLSPWLTSVWDRRSILGWAGQDEQEQTLLGMQRRAEQGSLMWAGSLPPPGLVAVQHWKAAANGMQEHCQITPRCLVFSLKMQLLHCCFSPFPTFPLLSPQLAHCAVLSNSMPVVESLRLWWWLCFSQSPAQCGEICHLLVTVSGGVGHAAGANPSSGGLCFPQPVSKLKVALKWGHQPFHMHGLSSSCVPAEMLCIKHPRGVGALVQERCWWAGACVGKGHWDAQPDLWREAGRLGTLQPGEEKWHLWKTFA